MKTAPVEPDGAVPVLSIMFPLFPAEPPTDVCSINDPLLVADPAPLEMVTEPPV
jgi:hypothetical protein